MNESGVVATSGAHSVTPGGLELASLESFVAEHYPRLIRLAGLVTRDAEQAQDAVQAALERAWRKRTSVEDGAKVRPWLDRIVVREAIRQTRGGLVARFLRRSDADWTDLDLSAPASEPAEAAALREALARLSPDHRAVIALHLHAGYSVEETSRILGIPFDTVRSRLRAARDRVRRELSEVKP